MRSAATKTAQSCFPIKSLSRVVVPTFIASAVLYSYYHDYAREKKLRSAFDKGSVPRPINFYGHIERQELAARVKRILQPPREYSTYDLIVGNYGTGKTTLVRHVGRECSGVIYVEVPALPEKLDKAFAMAINWSPSIKNWVEYIFGGQGEKDFSDELFQEFIRHAREFKQKNNRLAVLVYDQVENLAKYDPERLRVLQRIAQKAADDRLFKTVFITTGDRDTVADIADNGARIRIGRTLVIDELTCEESIDYLCKHRNRDEREAREIYALVGGQVELLTKAASCLEGGTSLEVWKELMFRGSVWVFPAAGMWPGGPARAVGLKVARRILEGGPLASCEYEKMVGDHKISSDLLDPNTGIFSHHEPSDTVVFRSTLLGSYAKVEIEKGY